MSGILVPAVFGERFYTLEPGGKTTALASVQVAGLMVIHGIQVVQEAGDPHIEIPLVESGSRFLPTVQILNGRLRQQITDVVLDT